MSTPATSVKFGFDFQTNAAIVLMIENITELSFVRIEGAEDIEIRLSDGTEILAQAKSVVNSSSDFSNVRQKAKKAVASLSEEAQKCKAKELIYITNTPDPFKDDVSKPMFYGHAHVRFDSLPQTAKDLVYEYLAQIKHPLDTSKLKIHVIPFEGDDELQRYKVIHSVISDFIGELDLDEIYGLKKKLHEVWQTMLDKNGTKANRDIRLSKKSIIWPIIVFVTRKGGLKREDQYCNLYDDSDYNEICSKYGEIIDYYSERYDFATKVVFDYAASGIKVRGLGAFESFINGHWEDYKSEIGDDSMNSEVRKGLIQIILFNILKRRVEIDKIKRAVNL